MSKNSNFMDMSELKTYTRVGCPPAHYTRKGRSHELLRRRDEKLAVRFYYHAHILGGSYSDILQRLQEEFDLSEKTVMASLRANQKVLNQLFATRPKASELRKRYPYWCF